MRSLNKAKALLCGTRYHFSWFARDFLVSSSFPSNINSMQLELSSVTSSLFSRREYSTKSRNQGDHKTYNAKQLIYQLFEGIHNYWEDCKVAHRCMPDPDEEIEEILAESKEKTAEHVLLDARRAKVDYKNFRPQDYISVFRDAFDEWQRSFNPDHLEEDGGLDKIGKRYAEKYKLDIKFTDAKEEKNDERELWDSDSPLTSMINAANEEEIDKQVQKWKNASPLQISPEEETKERERLMKELKQGGKHINRLAENRISLLNESVAAFMEGYHQGRYENQEELKNSVTEQIEKIKSMLEATDFSPESLEQKRSEAILYLKKEFTKKYEGIFDEIDHGHIDDELRRVLKKLESTETLGEIKRLETYIDKILESKIEHQSQTRREVNSMKEDFSKDDLKGNIL